MTPADRIALDTLKWSQRMERLLFHDLARMGREWGMDMVEDDLKHICRMHRIKGQQIRELMNVR
jgi:hypothetical protein